jgi:putative mRNA 3-end processing factor
VAIRNLLLEKMSYLFNLTLVFSQSRHALVGKGRNLADIVTVRPEGLYCIPGQFYIDAWQPVERTIVTHAHADHARMGHGKYLAANAGQAILRRRISDATIETLEYGERLIHNGVTISLHPAGHILGSAQVRLEFRGEIWVVSGDYKLEPDITCASFEPVRCDTFITESTFGLPIYRWQEQRLIFSEINEWWRRNAAQQRPSMLFCYALGKAQRILAGIDSDIGRIISHGAVENINNAYREAGVVLPHTNTVTDVSREDLQRSLVIAPPSTGKSPWLRRFGDYSDAFASGWMLLRGARRRRAVDRGFVLSDHADWPGLMHAIRATGAQRVIVTHGQVPAVVRWLGQQGLDAASFETEYGAEEDRAPASSELDGNSHA